MDLDISRIKINNVCRICLKTDNKLMSLFSNKVSEMLNFCNFITVFENDGWPQFICNECLELVVQSYKLKRLCLSSKVALEQLLKESRQEADIYITTCSNQDSIKIESISSNEFLCVATQDKDVSSNDETNDTLTQNSDELSTKENGFACEKCQEKFKFEKDASVHQSVHSFNLICNSCHKSFPTSKQLKRHIKTHMISKSHNCDVCNKGFSELAALTKHIRLNHLGIPRDKKYNCKDCGKRFTDKYYLCLHVRKHTGEKPLNCDMCSKSFYDPRSLKVHLLGHKGERAFLCSHCGKSFVQSSHLKKHLVVHTNEKSFVCVTCNKKFTQSSSLQRHKKKHETVDATK